jgi:hypothetical protein
MRRARLVLVMAALSTITGVTVSGCSTAPSATISITTGDETDTFSRAPAPTTLLVENIGLDGTVEQLASTALPTDDISLGDKTRTDVGAIRITASDATGKVVVRGESLDVQFGALEESTISIFAQRVGELARMPNGPAVLDAPFLGVTVGRYVVAASGTSVFLYDMLRLDSLSDIPVLPRTAKSFVTFGTAAIVIDDTAATTVDLSSQDTSDLVAPSGGMFSEVAGGASVYVADGSAFVVGGTRATNPTARVLSITKDGVVAWATLSTPRAGACATWVDGRGLVVVGGTTDPKAPGVEVIAPGAGLGTPLPGPADGVKGCGATTLDPTHILVAGGTGSAVDVMGAAPARLFDLTCSSNCAGVVWPGPLPLVRAEAFTLAPDAAIIAGDDATGATRMFRATAKGATEIAVKAARKNARLIALPVAGTVALVGGAAPIEQYRE